MAKMCSSGSTEVFSFLIDGTDQSAFTVPHFSTDTNGVCKHSLKLKLIGVLEHRNKRKLSLFTFTEDNKIGPATYLRECSCSHRQG